MRNGELKKFISHVLSMALIFTCFTCFTGFTGFTNYNGIGNVYYQSSSEIFDDTFYRELISEHAANGIEHAYLVEAGLKNSRLMPIVCSGEVRSVATVGDMVKYVESQGYKVVAAINGDIYDTSSGTPQGTVIHGGAVITSGYAPDRVIAFDEQGNASIEKIGLAYGAAGTIQYEMYGTTYTEVQVPVEKVVTVTRTAIDENGMEYEYTEEETVIEYETQLQPEATLQTVTEPVNLKIDFFNVPHGAANGLHLYNRHYSSSTKTKGTCAEAVIEADNVQLQVNGTIKGIVKSVNNATSNTEISNNTLVLSTVKGSATYDLISCLQVGSEIEISVSDTLQNGLSSAKEAIGFYYSLAEAGRNVTSGTVQNPRSAVGIKKDGSLVLAEVDGRQAGHSTGLSLTDLADMLIAMDCEYAVNLDGGGSSVMYVRQAGLNDTAALVSSPSEKTQRKVANAILLAYKATGTDSTVANLSVYPSYTIMMPGASASFSTAASNASYEKLSYASGVSYGTDSDYGYIDANGVFTAKTKTGVAEVTASSGKARGKASILITDEIVFNPSVSSLTVDAGESRTLSVKAVYGTERVSVPVIVNNELFVWSCDDNIGTIDANGVFTAASSTAQQGNIYVTYGSATKTIPVKVGANVVVFDDTAEHWAKEPIGILAGIGYLSGMGDNLFQPDGQLTRAQFLTMLYKITPQSDEMAAHTSEAEEYEPDAADAADGVTDADDTADTTGGQEPEEPEISMNFSDVPESEWFYDYIKWGYENGVANGMGDGTFAPNAAITREQMAVMLCNYSAATGFVLAQVKETPAFTDRASISDWAESYVLTVAGAGIINGFDTGEFAPQGVATRAQAAKVIYEFCKLKGIL